MFNLKKIQERIESISERLEDKSVSNYKKIVLKRLKQNLMIEYLYCKSSQGD